MLCGSMIHRAGYSVMSVTKAVAFLVVFFRVQITLLQAVGFGVVFLSFFWLRKGCVQSVRRHQILSQTLKNLLLQQKGNYQLGCSVWSLQYSYRLHRCALHDWCLEMYILNYSIVTPVWQFRWFLFGFCYSAVCSLICGQLSKHKTFFFLIRVC